MADYKSLNPNAETYLDDATTQALSGGLGTNPYALGHVFAARMRNRSMQDRYRQDMQRAQALQMEAIAGDQQNEALKNVLSNADKGVDAFGNTNLATMLPPGVLARMNQNDIAATQGIREAERRAGALDDLGSALEKSDATGNLLVPGQDTLSSVQAGIRRVTPRAERGDAGGGGGAEVKEQYFDPETGRSITVTRKGVTAPTASATGAPTAQPTVQQNSQNLIVDNLLKNAVAKGFQLEGQPITDQKGTTYVDLVGSDNVPRTLIVLSNGEYAIGPRQSATPVQ